MSSSSTTTPSISLTCLLGIENEFTPKSAGEIGISNMNISPEDLEINHVVLSIIVGLAKNFVFSETRGVMLEFVMTFSASNGVEFSKCSDQRIIDLFKMHKGEPVELFITEESEAVLQTLKHVKRPSNYISSPVPEQYRGVPTVFVEKIALQLLEEGIVNPFEIKVSIRTNLGTISGGILTASLRYPHMMHAIMKRYSDITDSHETKICIAGPGIQEGKCPQFVEFLALFPNAFFLLLDDDERVIKALMMQLQAKAFFYDLTVFRSRVFSLDGSGSLTPTPASYASFLERMKKILQTLARKPEDKRMIVGYGPIKPLMLNVDPKKIEVRKFEVCSSEFKKEDQRTFDMVIGTLSISFGVGKALVQNPNIDFIPFMQKHLELLKDGGTLYVDSHLIDIYYRDKSVWEALEAKMNATFLIEELPFSDLLPGVVGKHGNMKNITRKDTEAVLKKNQIVEVISTVWITAITRMPKRA